MEFDFELGKTASSSQVPNEFVAVINAICGAPNRIIGICVHGTEKGKILAFANKKAADDFVEDVVSYKTEISEWVFWQPYKSAGMEVHTKFVTKDFPRDDSDVLG